MKALHYFDQEAADQDDRELKAAIENGVVPPGCLLAGAQVLKMSDQDIDPCSMCPCDRERCGGRPPTTTTKAIRPRRRSTVVLNDHPTALREIREIWRKKILDDL